MIAINTAINIDIDITDDINAETGILFNKTCSKPVIILEGCFFLLSKMPIKLTEKTGSLCSIT